ncbi:MAG: prolipoprotein diacylglyceryl transferase family protein [Rubrivivax sp.]
MPIELASGIIGNFINGELWGRHRPTRRPARRGVPQSGSAIPRHRAAGAVALEELLLFVFRLVVRGPGHADRQGVGGLSRRLAMIRFIAEYFREPDGFLDLRAWTSARASGRACR